MKKEQIIETAKENGMHVEKEENGRIIYGCTVEICGETYKVSCSFDAAEYRKIMDDTAADEGALPWDDVNYTVTAL